jgi:hypothetical protein
MGMTIVIIQTRLLIRLIKGDVIIAVPLLGRSTGSRLE